MAVQFFPIRSIASHITNLYDRCAYILSDRNDFSILNLDIF